MIRRTLACALAIAGATAFVAAPPARAPTALCASHGKRGFKKLSLPADQRKALLRSLTTETIRHGRITTTHTRAKEVQKHVDKMITLGKRGDLHARRQAMAWMYDKQLVHALFESAAGRYADRVGRSPREKDVFNNTYEVVASAHARLVVSPRPRRHHTDWVAFPGLARGRGRTAGPKHGRQTARGTGLSREAYNSSPGSGRGPATAPRTQSASALLLSRGER